MYWTNLCQLTVRAQQLFKNFCLKKYSSHLYASFGTFCVQIGQLFVAQWVFKHSEECPNRKHFPSMTAICLLSNIFQRLTLPRVIDQFGRKRCQKKREDVEDKLIKEFFQKYFDEHERSAVKTSFSTYVCYAPDGCFWFLTKCIWKKVSTKKWSSSSRFTFTVSVLKIIAQSITEN